jgi:general secretion pathway protein D
MTIGATRNTMRKTTSLERSIVLEPTKKIQTGLLAVALGLGSAAFALGGTPSVFAQTPVAGVAQADAANSVNNSSLARSQELLLKARRSLMSRDVASAVRYASEAQALNVSYTPASDRPEYVFPLIEQYRRVSEAANVQGLTESVKRELAKNYLEQAEALRRCQDLDSADALVAEARNLNVTLDVATVNRKMDVQSVAARIADDRIAAGRVSPVQSAPLVGLSDATKRQVVAIQSQLKEARALVASGQVERAEAMVREIQGMGVPENAFAGGDSPQAFLRDVAVERSRSRAVRQVQATVPGVSQGESAGYLYVQEADDAAAKGNTSLAIANYRDALRYSAELDQATIRHINDSIARLNNPVASMPEVVVSKTGVNLDQSPEAIQSEIASFVAKQNQVRETLPKEALADLKQLRTEIEESKLDASLKAHFTMSVDMAINDTERFIDVHGARIAVETNNKDVEEYIRQKRQNELDMQSRLAEDTEKFKDLMEDGRYEEALILAKKCRDYSNNSVVSIQMMQQAQYGGQVAFNEMLRENKNERILKSFNDVENAAYSLVDDANPLVFDPEVWRRAENRKSISPSDTRSEADREIFRKLDMQISLPFDQPTPLDVVVDFIRTNTGLNIMVDEAALAESGATSDINVATNFQNIALKNYLKHVLAPYNLSYIVEDEVLTITGANRRSSKTVVMYYPVADLVIGVPDFNTTVAPLSMEASYNRAYQQAANRGVQGSGSTIAGLNNNVFGNGSPLLSPNITAQIQSSGASSPISTGQGGGMNDPSELISLITSVVDPESWETLDSEPQFFTLNNTLAIRQTEENHEEIRELLEKLRALNDLQVAVEVRFITISDEYFEKIGVNMNLSFKASEAASATVDDDYGTLTPTKRGVYGIYDGSATGKPFTDNLNVNFSQNSYGLAVPQFGNYDPSVGAQLGFAILSDIESYFFVSAAESDARTNVLQAPKVTMFNGQTASISDSTSVPYVSTVIPVVGDFAVAQQPVITIVNEGQFMTVQATASPDRKYVRMTVVPFFCKITDNDRTYKFEGTDSVATNSTSASKGSSLLDSITDERTDNKESQIVSQGTTIQEPITSSFSVYTTVNVPDGGTALLGGIKRLSEGRNEGGVPILSKIPYIKRLFSNSAIGRETTSMLMTVTPRIIIQEEEEEFATGLNASK